MDKPQSSKDPSAQQSTAARVRRLTGKPFVEVVNSWLESDKTALVKDVLPTTLASPPEPRCASLAGTDITLAQLAAQLYEERRLRDLHFEGSDLFGEPAWDILLDVAFAETKGERLALSTVCIGSCVPVSTAMRWVKILQSRNLVECDTGQDPRSSYVRLTEIGRLRTERYLRDVDNLRRVRLSN